MKFKYDRNTMAGAAERSQDAIPGVKSLCLAVKTNKGPMYPVCPWTGSNLDEVYDTARKCAGRIKAWALTVAPMVSFDENKLPYLVKEDMAVDVPI